MGGLWYQWKGSTCVYAREEKLTVPEFISDPSVTHLKKMCLPFQYRIKMVSSQMAKGKVERKKKKKPVVACSAVLICFESSQQQMSGSSEI